MALFEEIISGLFGEGGRGEYEQVQQLWQALQTPEFDLRDLPPPLLQIARERFPEEYEAKIAQQARMPQEGPEGRQAQTENLQYLASVRDQGLPMAERLRGQELQRTVAGEHHRAVGRGIEDLAQRGRMGGGTEAAMRMAAAQQAAELSRGLGSDLAREGVQNRFRGALATGEQAGAMRLQDLATSSAQSNAFNRFNEFVSTLDTQAAARSAQERSQVQAANVGTAQRVSDTNAMSQYMTSLQNLQRQNALTQQSFGNEAMKLGGQTGALQNLATAKYGEQAAGGKFFSDLLKGGTNILGAAVGAGGGGA